MKAATQHEIKKRLSELPKEDLLAFCLRLSRFKKENKELLTYLLFESQDEEGYIEAVKREVELQFEQINRSTYYFIKKSVRKIQRIVKKYVRYSASKETEVELLLHFCEELREMNPSIEGNLALKNLYRRQISAIEQLVKQLHPDLQYDYNSALSDLRL